MGVAESDSEFETLSLSEEMEEENPKEKEEGFSISSYEQEDKMYSDEKIGLFLRRERSTYPQIRKRRKKPREKRICFGKDSDRNGRNYQRRLTERLEKLSGKHDPAVQPEIRHSEHGEQLHMEAKNLTYVFFVPR